MGRQTAEQKVTDQPPISTEIVIIGAGIAGASAGYFLADTHRAVLLEQESQPGYHTTGRSAALFLKSYGPPQIRAVTAGGYDFFTDPPEGFTAAPLLSPRGTLHLGNATQTDLLAQTADEMAKDMDTVTRLDFNAAQKLVPVLRPEAVAGAIYEPEAQDIDVHALHQGFLRGLRQKSGQLLTDAKAVGLARHGKGWQVTLQDGRSVTAEIIVNAAGAWADEIGRLAGCRPIGLVPKRRTAILFDAPAAYDTDNWPVFVQLDESFYVKPDAGKLLGSPADETPMPPQDIQPDEYDIAVAVDRICTATTLEIRNIAHKWAGLRSFVADKTPVVGFDPEVSGFFWLAGQGGYGIQSAPGLGRLAASLLLSGQIPDDLAARGAEAAALAPDRVQS